MNPDQVDAIAREIRRYYLERKNASFGNAFRLTGHNANFSHWQKAAEVCIDLDATPETYVDAAFAYCRMSTGPYPNAMYGNSARAWYKMHTAGRSKTVSTQEKARSDGGAAAQRLNCDPALDALNGAIGFIKESLIRLTGTDEINETTLKYIGSMATGYAPFARVLLAYPSRDKTVKEFFGPEAYDAYVMNQSLYRAAEKLGYPIREILLWLNAPQL